MSDEYALSLGLWYNAAGRLGEQVPLRAGINKEKLDKYAIKWLITFFVCTGENNGLIIQCMILCKMEPLLTPRALVAQQDVFQQQLD